MNEETRSARARTNKYYREKFGVDIDEILRQYAVEMKLEKENNTPGFFPKHKISYAARNKLIEIGEIPDPKVKTAQALKPSLQEMRSQKRIKELEKEVKKMEVELSELSTEDRKAISDTMKKMDEEENIEKNRKKVYRELRRKFIPPPDPVPTMPRPPRVLTPTSVTIRPKLDQKIILPFFNFKKEDVTDDVDAWKDLCYNRVEVANIDSDDKIIYYDDKEGNTYCLIIEDMKRRFLANNFNYDVGKALDLEFIENFKKNYMKDEYLKIERENLYKDIPSLLSIIQEDILQMKAKQVKKGWGDIMMDGETDAGIKKDKECYYCKKRPKNSNLKSIVHSKQGTKEVYFCNFNCFESTDDSHWPKHSKRS
jgi:hypothetical protein